MIAAALRELMAAGVTGDALIAAIERIEAATDKRSKGAKRQARYIARQASQNVTNDDCDDNDASLPPPSPSPSSPPSDSPPNNPLPLSPPSSSLRSESIESDFPKDYREIFWNAYPRKVGKKTTIRKLELVRRNNEIPWAALLAAIARIDRKDPQFIPHPSTWLNEGRYLDGIATGPPPTTEPVWMKPPPGAVSYLDKMRTNGNGATLGTEIRNDAGLGKSGPDHPAELPLPGGSSLRRA